jgi:hypothetical protein
MRLTRLRRLGVVVTAGTLAADAALAIAPSRIGRGGLTDETYSTPASPRAGRSLDNLA